MALGVDLAKQQSFRKPFVVIYSLGGGACLQCSKGIEKQNKSQLGVRMQEDGVSSSDDLVEVDVRKAFLLLE